MDFKKRLSEIQGKVQEQMKNYTPGGGNALPDDIYTVRAKATLEYTKKKPERLTVLWQFVVAEGDFAGRIQYDRNIIEDNDIGANICRSRVEDLGVAWPEDDLTLLQDICEAITAQSPLVSVSLRTSEKNGYTNTNVKFKEILEEVNIDGGETPAEETPAEDEEPVEEPTEEPVEEETPTEDSNQEMLDFCAAQGIDGINEDMTGQDIVTALESNEITFPEAELSAEEIALLERYEGGSKLIIKPAKKTLQKPATKVTAKPAAKPIVKPTSKKR